MKLLSAAALSAFSVGCIVFALSASQQTMAQCPDKHSLSGCVTMLPDDEIPTLDSTAATQRHPANMAADGADLGTDPSATAFAVAPLGLFGSALVVLGYCRRKRSVHRQIG